jgi:hypothetical protein
VAEAPSPHTSRRRLTSAAGEVAGRAVDEAGVDVDAHHVPLGPHEARHEGGVVARTGADLQNAVPGKQAELREHDRHHRRLGRPSSS